MSLSGHKFHGLKGQGLLFVRNLHQIEPIVHGGGQEYGLRSGTVNLPIDIAIESFKSRCKRKRNYMKN